MAKSTSVLFVCLGNICRSPTAHAVFRQKLKATKLDVVLESAGTASYHIGATPDKRSIKHGQARNYDFSNLFARAVIDDDFEFYDHILVMDNANYQDLMARCPEIYQHKINLFLNYATNHPDYDEVPDPYYGGDQGFETVLDLIEDASDGLINTLSK
ncbi:protein-tyrosine-phosphatase [Psychrosphaera saromensis]|uniref:protein-tyrosine-phosphatase n=1 Tax=Psychrosphaera saromensis TaxID=716813 RepID=A0A2S7UXV8_9GAMM|nr:low molecular weight protein-tyrosine-phosphatase [Psychrosphaera saromensis]PQJ54322.1 protein-tyrosine-phosphatase [Psychrosphaera saromensis]GHB74294.1 protein-tyrosine-phosphatase [Psychrosphaera saromensis]GLQ12571.1 protein-tyrosine-phosphatase [Psychrosphaera saromensis]